MAVDADSPPTPNGFLGKGLAGDDVVVGDDNAAGPPGSVLGIGVLAAGGLFLSLPVAPLGTLGGTLFPPFAGVVLGGGTVLGAAFQLI